MTEPIQIKVPVVWIKPGASERLHKLADELHEQQTAIEDERYFWALHPDGNVVHCDDAIAGNMVEWSDLDPEDQWVIVWLRGEMEQARRGMP
jgi:hypothetical protein